MRSKIFVLLYILSFIIGISVIAYLWKSKGGNAIWAGVLSIAIFSLIIHSFQEGKENGYGCLAFIAYNIVVGYMCGGGGHEDYNMDSYYDYYYGDYYDDEVYVYICTGPKSKRYHFDEDCMGLSKCSGEVIEITLDEAEEMGRTECKYCCD